MTPASSRTPSIAGHHRLSGPKRRRGRRCALMHEVLPYVEILQPAAIEDFHSLSGSLNDGESVQVEGGIQQDSAARYFFKSFQQAVIIGILTGRNDPRPGGEIGIVNGRD